MRQLTIHRKKSFVGCLVSLQVYIEDHIAPELEINGTPCKKLGTIANGKQQTFLVTDQPARVYVIADQLSKNYCNDFYNLPAGDADIYITGKNHFDPFGGNPFYFDKPLDAETVANRKAGKKKGSVIMVIAIVIGLVIGTLVPLGIGVGVGIYQNLYGQPDPKTFSGEGMQITLNDDFYQIPQDDFTLCYGSADVAILILKEEFYLADGFGDYTLEEYGGLFLENNGLTSGLKTHGSITYFEYEAVSDENVTYHYFCPIFKSGDAFWLFQFATDADMYEQYEQSFFAWADTITFTNN